MKSFEDLKPGDSFTSESVLVTEEEILEFARRYDPQPIHTDAARAASGPFGGLIASGIQTLATSIRLMMQSGAFSLDDQLGSPGIEELRWPAPVRPGDTLHVVGQGDRSAALQVPARRGDRPLQAQRDQPEWRHRHDDGERRVHAHLDRGPAATQIALPQALPPGGYRGAVRPRLRYPGR